MIPHDEECSNWNLIMRYTDAESVHMRFKLCKHIQGAVCDVFPMIC